MESKQNKEIGDKIKVFRAKQGLTQDALARKCDIPYTTLTKIESNVITKPSIQTFMKTVAQATIDFYSDLEVSVDCSFADTTNSDEKDKRLVYLVAFYYSKTLYNISNAPGAESLMEYVQNIYEDWKADFKNNPEREYRPKLPEQYAYLVDKRDAKAIKTFRADLNESRRGTYSISTKIPTLEPDRYSPPSVVALIQYALNN